MQRCYFTFSNILHRFSLARECVGKHALLFFNPLNQKIMNTFQLFIAHLFMICTVFLFIWYIVKSTSSIAVKYKWKPIRALTAIEVENLKIVRKYIWRHINSNYGFCAATWKMSNQDEERDNLLDLIYSYKTVSAKRYGEYWFRNHTERRALIRFLIKHRNYGKV